MAAHLPGYAETQAVAALIGAACVSVLRLPLASVMIATLLSAKAGLAVAPLIVVAVAVAYLTSEALTAYVDARVGAAPAASKLPSALARTLRTPHPAESCSTQPHRRAAKRDDRGHTPERGSAAVVAVIPIGQRR